MSAINSRPGAVRSMTAVIAFLAVVALAGSVLFAQRGPDGKGRGKGPGYRGGRSDAAFQADREVFHFLLINGDKIQRRVKKLDNGIETITESDDPRVAAKIQEHVIAMYRRVKGKNPVHMRDPLFRALFSHADQIEMTAVKTKKGMRVVETSKDAYVARLLEEHAKVVSLFIKNGPSEAHKNHAVPPR